MEYFAFQWHITEACDQRCKHCYIYALGSHAKFQEMALEDMVRVIENCKGLLPQGRPPALLLPHRRGPHPPPPSSGSW